MNSTQSSEFKNINKGTQKAQQETPVKHNNEYMKMYSRHGETHEDYQKIAESIALECRTNFLNVRQQWLGESIDQESSKVGFQQKLDLLYPDSEVFHSIARKSYGQFLLVQSKRFNKDSDIYPNHQEGQKQHNFKSNEQSDNLHTFGDSLMNDKLGDLFMKKTSPGNAKDKYGNLIK